MSLGSKRYNFDLYSALCEIASNALPLPVSWRWSPLVSPFSQAFSKHYETTDTGWFISVSRDMLGYFPSFRRVLMAAFHRGLSSPGCLVPHRGGAPIRHIRHLLTRELALTLACSLILTRMDYCNSVLYGAPSSSIQILQRAQNNAARIVLQAPRRSHARPLLRDLHWLPIQHRIEYKVAVLTYKSRSSATAPIPQSSHQGSRQWTDTSLLYRTTTGQAVHQNGLCESSLSLRCTDHLELIAWNNNLLRLTVCI